MGGQEVDMDGMWMCVSANHQSLALLCDNGGVQFLPFVDEEGQKVPFNQCNQGENKREAVFREFLETTGIAPAAAAQYATHLVTDGFHTISQLCALPPDSWRAIVADSAHLDLILAHVVRGECTGQYASFGAATESISLEALPEGPVPLVQLRALFGLQPAPPGFGAFLSGAELPPKATLAPSPNPGEFARVSAVRTTLPQAVRAGKAAMQAYIRANVRVVALGVEEGRRQLDALWEEIEAKCAQEKVVAWVPQTKIGNFEANRVYLVGFASTPDTASASVSALIASRLHSFEISLPRYQDVNNLRQQTEARLRDLFANLVLRDCAAVDKPKSVVVTFKSVRCEESERARDRTTAEMLAIHARAMENAPDADQAQYPPEWGAVDLRQEFHFAEVPVPRDQWDGLLALGRFRQTLPNNTIIAITEIRNPTLWRRYQMQLKELKALERNKNNNQLTMWLWHGSRSATNEVKRTGIDMRVFNAGMWGRGAYFAVNAKYSYDYSQQCGNGGRMFFLCQVAIGTPKDLPSNSSILKPPEGFDCIKGNTNGSDVFIQYDQHRAYPRYLVQYQ